MLQNSVLILVMRYVRVRKGDMFLASTAVVMQEVIKLLSSLFLLFIEQGTASVSLSVCISVNRPAIVWKFPHFGFFPAFLPERPAFLGLFFKLKIAIIPAVRRHFLQRTLRKLASKMIASPSYYIVNKNMILRGPHSTTWHNNYISFVLALAPQSTPASFRFFKRTKRVDVVNAFMLSADIESMKAFTISTRFYIILDRLPVLRT